MQKLHLSLSSSKTKHHYTVYGLFKRFILLKSQSYRKRTFHLLVYSANQWLQLSWSEARNQPPRSVLPCGFQAPKPFSYSLTISRELFQTWRRRASILCHMGCHDQRQRPQDQRQRSQSSGPSSFLMECHIQLLQVYSHFYFSYFLLPSFNTYV